MFRFNMVDSQKLVIALIMYCDVIDVKHSSFKKSLRESICPIGALGVIWNY